MTEQDAFKCSCGGELKKIWFTDFECIRGVRTGRQRKAVSHLECDECLKQATVDDSFDEPWRYTK